MVSKPLKYQQKLLSLYFYIFPVYLRLLVWQSFLEHWRPCDFTYWHFHWWPLLDLLSHEMVNNLFFLSDFIVPVSGISWWNTVLNPCIIYSLSVIAFFSTPPWSLWIHCFSILWRHPLIGMFLFLNFCLATSQNHHFPYCL